MENDYYDNLIAYSYDDYVDPKEEIEQDIDAIIDEQRLKELENEQS